MNLRLKGSWLLAVMAATAGLLGEGEASAGIVLNKATSTSVPDPAGIYFYEYRFGFTITGPWTNGSYVEVTGLTGISSANNSVYDITTAAGTTASGWVASFATESVTFAYYTPGHPNPPIEGTETFALGTFYVGPAVLVDHSVSTPPPLTPEITSTGYDPNGNVISGPQNLRVTFVSVPEPSSLVLLLAGAGVIPLIWLRRKNTRRAATGGPAV